MPGREGEGVPGRSQAGWSWWRCGVGTVLCWGQLGCHVAMGQGRSHLPRCQSTTRGLATPTLGSRFPVAVAGRGHHSQPHQTHLTRLQSSHATQLSATYLLLPNSIPPLPLPSFSGTGCTPVGPSSGSVSCTQTYRRPTLHGRLPYALSVPRKKLRRLARAI